MLLRKRPSHGGPRTVGMAWRGQAFEPVNSKPWPSRIFMTMGKCRQLCGALPWRLLPVPNLSVFCVAHAAHISSFRSCPRVYMDMLRTGNFTFYEQRNPLVANSWYHHDGCKIAVTTGFNFMRVVRFGSAADVQDLKNGRWCGCSRVKSGTLGYEECGRVAGLALVASR